MTDLAFDVSDTQSVHKQPVNDEMPVVSRTVTSPYAFPPALPVAVPPADQCTRSDLLDLADGADRHADQMWQLLGSRAHVQAICHDYGRLALELQTVESELADAHRATDSANRDYTREVARHNETVSQLNRLFLDSVKATAQLTAERQARAADLKEIERLRDQVIRLSTTNTTLAHAMAAVAAKAHAMRGSTNDKEGTER